MSLRDVKEYYFQIEQQYFDMNQTAKELNEECEKGNVTKEMVSQAEAMILPLKQNYERLSYILYLFNKPNKKKKINKFNRQNVQLLNSFSNLKATENDVDIENVNALKNFKEYVKSLEVEQ